MHELPSVSRTHASVSVHVVMSQVPMMLHREPLQLRLRAPS